MPTVHLDAVRDAELEATPQQTMYVRTGWVDDIDLADTPDPDALIKVMALPEIPDWYSPLSAAAPNMKYVRLRIKPEEAKFRRCRLWLTYETILTNLTPTAYTLKDRTYTVQKSDWMIPGLRQPMMLGFEIEGTTLASATPISGKSAEQEYKIDPQPIFLNTNVSARSIQLTMLMYGRPNGGGADYTNYLNDATWPVGDFQFNQTQTGQPTPVVGASIPMESATPLPKAYWRLNQYSTSFDRQNGMTLVETEAVTKIIEDWSQYGMARHEGNGKFPFGSLSTDEKLQIIAAANAPDYVHGPIYPTGTTKHRGYGRWGQYPLTDFHDLFGGI